MSHEYHTVYVPPTSGLNVAALVLGIVSLVVPFIGLLTAPLAVIFAGVAMRRHEQNGMGVAGLVTGLVAITGYLVWVLIVFAFAASTAPGV